jgi:hypothetical protein
LGTHGFRSPVVASADTHADARAERASNAYAIGTADSQADAFAVGTFDDRPDGSAD